MADFTRPGRFDFSARGVDLNTPIDRLRESGYFYYLKNVDVLTDGSIEPRAGLTDRYASYVPIVNKTPHHSALRLNDSSAGSSAWTLIHGVGDTLAVERSSAVGTLVALDSGYSARPLSISVYRPPRAVQPWAYVGDSSRMRKLRQDVTSPTTHLVGLPAPTFEPIAWPSTGAFKALDLFEPSGGGTGYTRWTAIGPGAAVGAVVGQRVNTAQNANIPFEVVTGADEISIILPASMANIGVGAVVNINEAGPTTENVLVTQVNKSSATLTISAVIYDSGTTGLCSVVLSASVREITTNSMLFNSTKNEYVRVRSVTSGSDGAFSVRVSTTTTWVAANSVAAVASFVCHPLGAGPTPIGNITSAAMFVTSNAGTSTFTQTISLDLSQLSWSSVPAASTLGDFMHISMLVDHPELITEMKLLLDIDGLVPDFTQNYYFRAISPSDLTPVTHNSQSVLDNRQAQVTKRILDRADRINNRTFGPQFGAADPSSMGNIFSNPNPAGIGITDPGGDDSNPAEPPRTQTTAGDNQWSEIIFPLNSMEKVGADDSRGFKDVSKIRIQVVCTGAVIVSLDSWTIEGGFAPLVEPENGESGYLYAYRARASSTGAVSDLSPLCRGESNARRQRVAVQLQQYTAASEVDYLDVFRIGGPVPIPSFVGSVANSATPFFIDIFDNTSVFDNRTAGGTFDPDDPDLQPWPETDIPRSGTATSVSGTTVQSAAQFNTSWLPGTIIVVDGVATTIYRVISTSKLEVTSSLGVRTNVAWQVSEPVLGGQPFEMLWGPFNDHLLAVGSRRNPGSLYFTKPKNPDSTSRARRLEITSNSDPLLNGFIFNGRAGVFSSRNLYYLDYIPSDPSGPFSANVSPNDKGLYARWAMAVGRRGVAWLASDGIYMMQGSGAVSLTDKRLRPLFRHGDRPGVDTNGIPAPVMPNPVGAEEVYLRLFFDHNDNLRFVYRDGSSNMQCLFYDFSGEGWRPFTYGKPITDFYTEEGAGVINLIAGTSETTGHVYTVGGSSDNGTDAGTSIACAFTTYAYDANDPRAQKQWGDTDVDVNPGGASVVVDARFDNLATHITPSASPLIGSSRAVTVLDFNSGDGEFARNMALSFSWSNGAGQRPHFYLWEPAYIIHPEDTLLRATDYDFTESGLGYVRGLWVDADTGGDLRTIDLDYIDHLGGQQTYTITVSHPVKSRIFYPISPTPFYCSTLRLHPNDASSWKQYSYHLVHDPAPPFSTELTPFTDGGDQRNKFLQGARVKIDTHGSVAGLEVQGDNGAVLGTFTGLSSVLPTVVPLVLNPAMRTHLARIRPLNSVHLFEVTWDWQSDAELVAYYEGQESSFDIPGFKHAREVYVAYSSASAPLTLALVADGVAIAGIPTLPASASYTRVRIVLPAKKWKAVKPYLTSTSPFMLYSRDSNILTKAWGDMGDGGGDYRSFELFGTMHRDRGIATV